VTFFLKLQKAEDVNYEEAVELPVLVVDDDRMECEAVCEILDKMGMRSEGVLSDKEAIERIKKHRETLNDFLAVIDRTRVKKANGEALLKKFPQMNLKGKRALVVEDNELNAEIAKETLEKTGVEVECAENGAKAIDKIASRDNGYYDIVFMDIQMPVMDGEAATRAIRAMGREYTDALPVIAMTANALSEDVHAAKAAGMNGYISKPLELDILADMLYKWLIFGNQELHRAQAL
jgi:CheY-like chemotaxis protein